jgi:hypothetical protein
MLGLIEGCKVDFTPVAQGLYLRVRAPGNREWVDPPVGWATCQTGEIKPCGWAVETGLYFLENYSEDCVVDLVTDIPENVRLGANGN